MWSGRNRESVTGSARTRRRRARGDCAGAPGPDRRSPAYAVGPAATISAGTVARYLSKLASKRAASALAWSS